MAWALFAQRDVTSRILCRAERAVSERTRLARESPLLACGVSDNEELDDDKKFWKAGRGGNFGFGGAKLLVLDTVLKNGDFSGLPGIPISNRPV